MRTLLFLIFLGVGLRPTLIDSELTIAQLKESFESVAVESGHWKIKFSSKTDGMKWQKETGKSVTSGMCAGQTEIVHLKECLVVENKKIRWVLCSVGDPDTHRIKIVETITSDGDFSSANVEIRETILQANPDGTLIRTPPVNI